MRFEPHVRPKKPSAPSPRILKVWFHAETGIITSGEKRNKKIKAALPSANVILEGTANGFTCFNGKSGGKEYLSIKKRLIPNKKRTTQKDCV